MSDEHTAAIVDALLSRAHQLSTAQLMHEIKRWVWRGLIGTFEANPSNANGGPIMVTAHGCTATAANGRHCDVEPRALPSRASSCCCPE
jgi:hypothetical protein